MKNCPYCKIEVGGNLKKCPLILTAFSSMSTVFNVSLLPGQDDQ